MNNKKKKVRKKFSSAEQKLADMKELANNTLESDLSYIDEISDGSFKDEIVRLPYERPSGANDLWQ